MKKSPVIRKEIKFSCGRCDGIGKVNKKRCPKCFGKGYYTENHYYFIDYKQGICFDADNLN
jgi:DnaJ-class molecular chaperone